MLKAAVAISRKSPAKAQEAARQAQARVTAAQALAPVLSGLSGEARGEMAEAVLDVALDLHRSVHHPRDTATKVCGWAGRNCPDIERPDRSEAEALFKKDAVQSPSIIHPEGGL